jgi:hypothetical protein
MLEAMRTPFLPVVLLAAAASPLLAAQGAAKPDCVTIATPKPAVIYTFQHVESSGNTTQTTQQWDSVTATGSRVRITGPAGVQTQINEHHVVNDTFVLDKTAKENGNGAVIDATTFRPGLVSDPAFQACAGGQWPIPAVTASYRSSQNSASVQTTAGTLRIVAIRERVTVPAGSFDTVHYIRTSQSVDEYWKSTAHGVIVRHIAKTNGVTITETLQSIK